MGAYINPSTESKLAFIDREGTKIEKPKDWAEAVKICGEDKLVVIEIDNGMFTAMGILFNEFEFTCATDPSDKRNKFYYIVPIEKLWLVSNFHEYRTSLLRFIDVLTLAKHTPRVIYVSDLTNEDYWFEDDNIQHYNLHMGNALIESPTYAEMMGLWHRKPI